MTDLAPGTGFITLTPLNGLAGTYLAESGPAIPADQNGSAIEKGDGPFRPGSSEQKIHDFSSKGKGQQGGFSGKDHSFFEGPQHRQAYREQGGC